MTLADQDCENSAREVEDVPDPQFGDDCSPGEAACYYWEYDEPPDFVLEQVEQEYEYPAWEEHNHSGWEEYEEIEVNEQVLVKQYDVRVQVEELDEYSEEEEDEEEEQDTPRAALLAAWWDYKRQNRHRRKRKKIITLYRVDNSDSYADEEEFNNNDLC